MSVRALVLAACTLVAQHVVPAAAHAAVPAATHAASTATHRVTATVIDPSRGMLAGLSCPTAQFCATVEHDATGPYRLVTFGTGEPQLTDTTDRGTDTIACGTASFCVAGAPAAAYVWDGASWDGPQALGSAALQGPVCARGTSLCLYYGPGSTLVHTGSGWQTVALPAGFSPTGVSCATAMFCEAVSDSAAAHFDGTGWQSDPAPPAAVTRYGAAISCVSSTYCAVEGDSGTDAVFDGSSWQLTDLGLQSDEDFTCVAPSDCRALQQDNIVEVAQGGELHKVRLSRSDYFVGLSCPSADLCRVANSSGTVYGLAGTQWTSADQVAASAGYLTAVSCASATWCMAVDGRGNVLHYSHGHWSKPHNIDGNTWLAAISCSRSRVCVAIDASYGHEKHGVDIGARAIRYSDGVWHDPQVVETGAILTGVSCPTATHCWIVDRAGNVIARKPGGWRKPEKVGQSLAGIDCTSPTYCFAAGGNRSTVEYNGHHWRRAATGPIPFEAVGCLRHRLCLAAELESGYVFHWFHNGIWLSKSPGGTGAESAQIDCHSRRFCIGVYTDDDEYTYALKTDYQHKTRTVHRHGYAVTCTPNGTCVWLKGDTATVVEG